MEDKNMLLRVRLHNVFIQNPMSLTDLARMIGVSFNTLKKFMDPSQLLNASPLCKIERFVLMQEVKINNTINDGRS